MSIVVGAVVAVSIVATGRYGLLKIRICHSRSDELVRIVEDVTRVVADQWCSHLVRGTKAHRVL